MEYLVKFMSKINPKTHLKLFQWALWNTINHRHTPNRILNCSVKFIFIFLLCDIKLTSDDAISLAALLKSVRENFLEVGQVPSLFIAVSRPFFFKNIYILNNHVLFLLITYSPMLPSLPRSPVNMGYYNIKMTHTFFLLPWSPTLKFAFHPP